MLENIIIIGTSTAANNIYNFIEKYRLYNVLGFAVNEEYITSNTFLGKPVFCIEKLDDTIDKENVSVFVAMQWNKLNSERRKVYEELKSKGYRFANLISPLASINGAIAGDNCWISDFACIDTDSVIGNNVFIKIGALVANQTEISDHCFIGARAVVAGGCKVGEQSFIGLGAIILDDTTIGKKCIVGAGTTVKRNLPDCSVCKLAAESCITRQYPDEIIESKLMFSKNIR